MALDEGRQYPTMVALPGVTMMPGRRVTPVTVMMVTGALGHYSPPTRRRPPNRATEHAPKRA